MDKLYAIVLILVIIIACQVKQENVENFTVLKKHLIIDLPYYLTTGSQNGADTLLIHPQEFLTYTLRKIMKNNHQGALYNLQFYISSRINLTT